MKVTLNTVEVVNGVPCLIVSIPLRSPKRSGGPTEKEPHKEYGNNVVIAGLQANGRNGPLETTIGKVYGSASLYVPIDSDESTVTVGKVLKYPGIKGDNKAQVKAVAKVAAEKTLKSLAALGIPGCEE